MLGHLPYDAIGALAQFFCDIVSLVNNEILVENLEVLATSHVRHLVISSALAADRLRVGVDRRETMWRMNGKAGRCDWIMDEVENWSEVCHK